MSTIEEIEARLAQRAAEPPPESWKPEKPGDAIIGRVRRYERGSTSWGDCVICVVESLRAPGRFASIWIFGTVLANAFQRVQPRLGEVIRVEFRGVVEPTTGGPAYKDWTLVADRAEGDGLSYAEAAGVPVAQRQAAVEDVTPTQFPTTGDFDAAQTTATPDADTDDIPF
jgi:hypothetical protein